MGHFKNIAESFYREVRRVEIYKAEDISYIDTFNGVFPDTEQIVVSFDIVPEGYDRGIRPKTQNGYYFTDINISFSLLDMSLDTVDKCNQYFNKKEFAIVLYSNIEKMLLGNDREKLKIEIIDYRKEDNSGNDEYTIAISGDTIIKPQTKYI